MLTTTPIFPATTYSNTPVAKTNNNSPQTQLSLNLPHLAIKDIPLTVFKAYSPPISFGCNEESHLCNLKVTLDNVDSSIITSTNGVGLNKAFKAYNKTLKKAVDRIYRDKNTPGQWLKWIDLPEAQLAKAQEIQDFVNKNVRYKFDDVVILGIGGSSLGAKALFNALAHSEWNELSAERRNGFPRIHFIENIDPDRFNELVEKLDMNRTLINVISKSGKTPEPSATFLNLQERMKNVVGGDKLKDHIIAITDVNPDKSILKAVAVQSGYKTYIVPDDVGGRYSVLSDVGMVPAAMAGIDIKELLRGARDMSKACLNTSNLRHNPATSQALIHYLMYKNGKDYSVMVPYSDKLALVSDWYAQLWAESLGKKETAYSRILNLNHSAIKALGAIDQHSQLQLWREGKNDKVYTLITVKDFNNTVPIAKDPANIPDGLSYMRHNSLNDLMREEEKATAEILTKDKRPVINIQIPKVDAYNLGQLLQMFMLQTAILGELHGLGINNYLQFAVEEGKVIATSRLAEMSKQKAFP